MDCFQLFKNFAWITLELDLQGNVFSCNEVAANWFALPQAELVGKNFLELCKTKNLLPPFLSPTVKLSPESVVFQTETYGINVVGDLVFLRWKSQWVRSNDEIKGLFLLGEDVSDQIHLRQQQQQTVHRIQGLSKELTDAKAAVEQEALGKSVFLANMSHDLKTPLHAVLGMAEILKVKKHLPEQDEYIEGILSAGQRILRVVEDVLNCARVESGKSLLQMEAFDLRKLIEEVVDALASQANQKNLQLIISYCESVSHFVQSDPQAIRKIIVHLLTNAIKFTQKGYVMITVETAKQAGKRVDLQITVEDTGIGISKANLEKIFERFYRIDPTYKGQYSGTGVGLTISKQLAEDLGGKLQVNSREGSGSTFWCTLPFHLTSEVTPPLESFPYRVLVVDDLLVRGQAIRKQIQGEQHQVVRGLETIATLKQAQMDRKAYDLILMDDQLSGMTMVDLAQTIDRELGSDAPVLIAMVQPVSLELQQRLKAAGFVQQLVKPIHPSKLHYELTHALQNRQKVSNIATSAKNLKHQVLLVEDNVFSQRVTKIMLEAIDCELSIASTGAAACKLLAEKSFEIIFMDLELPDIDGIDVAKRIRNDFALNRNAYVCALTAHVDSAARSQCLKAGMNDFLGKPAQLEEFRRVIVKAQDLLLQNIMNVMA